LQDLRLCGCKLTDNAAASVILSLNRSDSQLLHLDVALKQRGSSESTWEALLALLSSKTTKIKELQMPASFLRSGKFTAFLRNSNSTLQELELQPYQHLGETMLAEK
jgi:hypothetical protein